MLEQILKNSIHTVLEHEPDEKEFKTFVDYIEGVCIDMENAGKQIKLSDVVNSLFDCRRDCFVQCDECGKWLLSDSDEWNEREHCCCDCKSYSDPDMLPGGHDYY